MVVRPFISSTFEEKLREVRDHLQRHTFPILKNEFEELGIGFSAIDLRWGIVQHEEDSLARCLEEIDISLPYFVVILGAEYGSPIRELSDTLPLRYKDWLTDRWEGRGYTEIEIQYALQCAKLPTDGLFFYRQTQTSEVDKRLRSLENWMEKQGCSIQTFANNEELDSLLLADFRRVQSRLKQQAPKLDRYEHYPAAAFCNNHQLAYVPRDEIIVELCKLRNQLAPLIITGAPGCGKSVVVRAFIETCMKETDTAVLAHSVGFSIPGRTWPEVVEELLLQAKSRYHVSYDSTQLEPAALKKQLCETLMLLAQRSGKLVVALDGLDRLEWETLPDLTWLPQIFLPNVFLICSCRPGPVFELLMHRNNWRILEIRRMSVKRSTHLCEKYLLAHFGKRLKKDDLLDWLVKSEIGRNPLGICTLMNELALFGDRKALPERLKFLSASASISELFGKFLGRLAETGSPPGSPNVDAKSLAIPPLIELLGLLAASRGGLIESDIQELGEFFGCNFSLEWRRSLANLAPFLARSNGYMQFGYTEFQDYLRDFYRQRRQQNAPHVKLAEYFSKNPGTPRAMTEIPYHLEISRQWSALGKYIATPAYLDWAWKARRADVLRFASLVARHSPGGLGVSFKHYLQSPLDHPNAVLLTVIHLLQKNGDIREAYQLCHSALNERPKCGTKLDECHLIGMLSSISRQMGNFAEAKSHLEEQRTIAAELGAPELLAAIDSNLGTLLSEMNEYEAAAVEFERCATECEARGDQRGSQIARFNWANALIKTGKSAQADAWVELQTTQAIADSDFWHLQRLKGQKAAILMSSRRDSGTAVRLLREQEAITRLLSSGEDLANCLENIAVLQQRRGNYADSIEALLECIEIRECVDDPVKLCDTDLTLASILLNKLGQSKLGSLELILAQESLDRIGKAKGPGDTLRRRLADLWSSLRARLGMGATAR